MQHIYHGVPKDLVGNRLMPLNVLRQEMPEVYAREKLKYTDHPSRAKLPEKRLPFLDCTRADVLHCSPVDPRLIFRALKSVFPEGNRSVLFYKVPVERLQGVPGLYFDINHPAYKFGFERDPEEVFSLIDWKDYAELNGVPQPAIEFFEKWKSDGQLWAPAFGKIPHVFVMGEINVEGLQVIDWAENS